MTTPLPCLIATGLAAIAILAVAAPVHAEETPQDARTFIQFEGDFEATCVSRNAKQILVRSTHSSRAIRVWLDRVNGGVGTGDRSRSLLKPGAEAEPLGCSRTLEGAAQEWRVGRAEFVASP